MQGTGPQTRWLFLSHTYHYWYYTIFALEKNVNYNTSVTCLFMLVKCRKDKEHFMLFKVIPVKVISLQIHSTNTNFQVHCECRKTWETGDDWFSVKAQILRAKTKSLSFFKSFQCSSDRCGFDSSICHQHFLTLNSLI